MNGMNGKILMWVLALLVGVTGYFVKESFERIDALEARTVSHEFWRGRIEHEVQSATTTLVRIEYKLDRLIRVNKGGIVEEEN